MSPETFQSIQHLLSGIVCGSSLGSAYYWYRSSTAKVEPQEEKPDESGFFPARIIDEGADLLLSLKKQAKFNHLAAHYAAVAAIVQTANSLLDTIK